MFYLLTKHLLLTTALVTRLSLRFLRSSRDWLLLISQGSAQMLPPQICHSWTLLSKAASHRLTISHLVLFFSSCIFIWSYLSLWFAFPQFKFHESRDLVYLCVLSTWYTAPRTVPDIQDQKMWNEWMNDQPCRKSSVERAQQGSNKRYLIITSIGLWCFLVDLRNIGVWETSKMFCKLVGKYLIVI